MNEMFKYGLVISLNESLDGLAMHKIKPLLTVTYPLVTTGPYTTT